MVVLIDGQPASGKSLIRGMLDGHPEVFSDPFHDLIPLAFTHIDLDKKALYAKDVEWLRTQISTRARYYRVERISKQGYFPFEVGAGEIVNIPVNLDFYSLDKSFIQELDKLSEWRPENITESFYRALCNELYSEKNFSKTIYATLGNGDIQAPRRYLERFPESKLIYVDRKELEIIASIANRPPQPGNYRTEDNDLKKIFSSRVSSGIIAEIKGKRKEISKLKKDNPDRVLILEFDAFFLNFEGVKKRLIEFLGIKDSSNLDCFTFINKEMRLSNGKSYFDTPRDSARNILNSSQIHLVEALSELKLLSFFCAMKSWDNIKVLVKMLVKKLRKNL